MHRLHVIEVGRTAEILTRLAELATRMEGSPVTGTVARAQGDLVLVGSDSVFDQVLDGFPRDVLRYPAQAAP